jgi:hypothetical protein
LVLEFLELLLRRKQVCVGVRCSQRLGLPQGEWKTKQI